MTTRFASFAAFWPFYLREHAKPLTRALHYIGTLGALGLIVAALAIGWPRLLLVVPFLGYGPAWIAHYFVEKNRPATFTHPLWSLYGDILMCALFLAGKLDAELERHQLPR
jgi:hypothetical protein